MTPRKATNGESRFVRGLRLATLIAVLAGAPTAFGLMLQAASRQKSIILLVLFGLWVLSPFVVSLLVQMVLKRRAATARATLYIVTLLVIAGSLTIYGNAAFGHPIAKIGFIFLVVPFTSCVLIGISAAFGFMLRDK
jgi:hypothetical protein